MLTCWDSALGSSSSAGPPLPPPFAFFFEAVENNCLVSGRRPSDEEKSMRVNQRSPLWAINKKKVSRTTQQKRSALYHKPLCASYLQPCLYTKRNNCRVQGSPLYNVWPEVQRHRLANVRVVLCAERAIPSLHLRSTENVLHKGGPETNVSIYIQCLFSVSWISTFPALPARYSNKSVGVTYVRHEWAATMTLRWERWRLLLADVKLMSEECVRLCVRVWWGCGAVRRM